MLSQNTFKLPQSLSGSQDCAMVQMMVQRWLDFGFDIWCDEDALVIMWSSMNNAMSNDINICGLCDDLGFPAPTVFLSIGSIVFEISFGWQFLRDSLDHWL